jgi:hypothetical protein
MKKPWNHSSLKNVKTHLKYVVTFCVPNAFVSHIILTNLHFKIPTLPIPHAHCNLIASILFISSYSLYLRAFYRLSYNTWELTIFTCYCSNREKVFNLAAHR